MPSTSEPAGPLAGIRVLDLSRVLAGPYCSMMLGDLGADVIKIERPVTGDDTRHWGPPFVGPGESAYYAGLNRNKRSVAVDLKTPDGVNIVRELARVSDVVIENFAPGVAESLGIGYETLRKLNPRIVYCSITGFGPDGPYRDRPGYDLVVEALGGLMGITGEPDRPPVKVGVAITDVCTGLAAQGAITAALFARERRGVGQRIDLSLLESQIAALVNIASSFLVSGQLPRRWGTAHESIVPYQGFEAADAALVIAVGNDEQWRRLCAALEQPGLATDPRFATNPLRVEHRDECVAAVGAIITTRTRDEWLRRLDAAGIPCAPINSLEEVFSNPQVLHRKMLVEMEDAAGRMRRMVGLPVKYSATPGSIRRLPPKLGEHTEEVLSEVLGYHRARITALRSAGVIA